jgi:hypothetical protein
MTSMRGRWRARLAPLALVALTACTIKGSMRRFEVYQIGAASPYTVDAFGYPSAGGNAERDVFYNLTIRLKEAPPFTFVFADGYRANSREITATELSVHHAPITVLPDGRLTSSINLVLAWERRTISFYLDKEGQPYDVWIYACRLRIPGLLATADGARVFDFPLRRDELRTLVGPPTNEGSDIVLLGADCDIPE